MKILILDDDITRHNIFAKKLIGNIVVHTTTVAETIHELKDEIFDILFLDHDLGGFVHVQSGKGTGYEVAEWLVNNPDRMPKRIIIHSFNSVGAQNIKNLLPQSEIIAGTWNLIS